MKQYTTIEMVTELFKNPSLHFKRFNDEVFKIFTDNKDIKFRVHAYEGILSLLLYQHELWLLDEGIEGSEI